MKGGRNPWRGERVLTCGEQEFRIAATMDTVARAFEAAGTDTFDAFEAAMAARNPATVRRVLDAIVPEDAEAIMQAAPGLHGLSAIYEAVCGALSGLTPEEEEAAKKAQAEAAERAETRATAVMMTLLKKMATEARSDASQSDA